MKKKIKYKVSIIEPVGFYGGNDLYLLNLLDAYNMNSNCRAVLFSSIKEDTNFNQSFIFPYFNKVFSSKNVVIKLVNYYYAFFKSLFESKKNKTDIIHLHFFGFSSVNYINLILAKYFFKFKIVVTVHDIKSFSNFEQVNSTKSYSRYLSLTDQMVFHTKSAEKEFKKMCPPIFYNRFNVVYACDLDYRKLLNKNIDICFARKRLKINKNKDVVMFFGQIKKVKNLNFLLEGFLKARDINKNLFLIIAGKAWKDDINQYKRKIKTHNLEKHVLFIPSYIPDKDIDLYFNASDIIALPYKKIYNSGVLIRAMSYSRPVIASNLDVFQEFVVHLENGLIYEENNLTDFVDKLIYFFKNPLLKEEFGNKSKENIFTNFSLKTISLQYDKIFLKVMS